MSKKILISIVVACGFFACETPKESKEKESKEIVFVCTHGAARSPIAAAYFNKLAKENGLNYYAVFRGTEPDTSLTKETVYGLTKDGFETSNWKPEKVSDQDVETAHKIVTFDCSIPSAKFSEMVVEWNGTPSISEDYNAARDVIKDKVEKLIEHLKKE